MALITQEEVKKLATLSCIHLAEHEVAPLCESLNAVLDYASDLKDIAAQYPDVEQTSALINVMRADAALRCTQPIVDQAPVHENNYFVVPVIIKQA